MTEHQTALDTFSYGVYIATCKADDKANGLTMGWVTQVSLDPALLAIAVNKSWYTHGLLTKSGHFVLHVLAEDQVELARKFGTTHGWDTDKFEGVEWRPGVQGIPVLQGCKAVIECRMIQAVDAGDHTLFVGQVMSSQLDQSKREQVLDREMYPDS